MSDYADYMFNLTNLVVAAILPDGSVSSTSVALEDGSKLSFEVKSDKTSVKSYGMMSRAAAIPTHIEGEIEYASFNAEALPIICGLTAVETGTTPNRITTSKFLAGNAGVPYFALIGALAADDGGNGLVGLYKVKLDSHPGITQDQNNYIIYNQKFTGVIKAPTSRELYVLKQYETAIAVAADISVYFA